MRWTERLGDKDDDPRRARYTAYTVAGRPFVDGGHKPDPARVWGAQSKGELPERIHAAELLRLREGLAG